MLVVRDASTQGGHTYRLRKIDVCVDGTGDALDDAIAARHGIRPPTPLRFECLALGRMRCSEVDGRYGVGRSIQQRARSANTAAQGWKHNLSFPSRRP